MAPTFAPTNFASFSRALSPTSIAAVNHGADHRSSSRTYASAHAQTWQEVVACIPVSYRAHCAGPLKSLYDLAVKVSHAEAAYNRLLEAKSQAGTPPPQILGIHEPKWTMAKEFELKAADLKAQSHQLWLNYRNAALDKGLELKEAELSWLKSQLEVEAYWPPIEEMLKGTYDAIRQKYRIPASMPQDDGSLAYEVPESLHLEYGAVRTDVSAYCIRVIEIERSRVLAEKYKNERKAQLHKAAEVELGSDDMAVDQETVTKADVASVVEKTMEKFLKSQAQKSTPKSQGKGPANAGGSKQQGKKPLPKRKLGKGQGPKPSLKDRVAGPQAQHKRKASSKGNFAQGGQQGQGSGSSRPTKRARK
ncbi:hypothetical protein FRB98_002552 [Tulasnella sp. 332]|nr:hypothetical protein FRB98_002552 [Tulasnella sp. 332]